MIVCSCNAVTDKQILRAARAGARSPREVARICRAGAGCGGCRVIVEDLLDEVHGETQARSEAPLYSPSEDALGAS